MSLLVGLFSFSTQRTPVYIGGFFSLSPNKASVPGGSLLAAAELALEHVNKSNILQEYELRMIVKDSKVHFIFLLVTRLLNLCFNI